MIVLVILAGYVGRVLSAVSLEVTDRIGQADLGVLETAAASDSSTLEVDQARPATTTSAIAVSDRVLDNSDPPSIATTSVVQTGHSSQEVLPPTIETFRTP